MVFLYFLLFCALFCIYAHDISHCECRMVFHGLYRMSYRLSDNNCFYLPLIAVDLFIFNLFLIKFYLFAFDGGVLNFFFISAITMMESYYLILDTYFYFNFYHVVVYNIILYTSFYLQ